MIASPTIALNLPLKLLIQKDGSGKVWISYNSAEFITHRHSLSTELIGVLGGVSAIATAIAS